MFRRSGHRFADKNMRKQIISGHVAIPLDRDMSGSVIHADLRVILVGIFPDRPSKKLAAAVMRAVNLPHYRAGARPLASCAAAARQAAAPCPELAHSRL